MRVRGDRRGIISMHACKTPGEGGGEGGGGTTGARMEF